MDFSTTRILLILLVMKQYVTNGKSRIQEMTVHTLLPVPPQLSCPSPAAWEGQGLVQVSGFSSC